MKTLRVSFWLTLALAACVLLTQPGCQSAVSVDPGRTSLAQTDTVTHQPDGSVVHQRKVEGEAIGPAGRASGDKIDQKFSGKPADLKLPGLGSGTGGGVSSDTDASVSMGSPLVWAAVLCFIASGACIYFGLRGPSVACAATGGVLLAIGMYPAILLYGLGLCVVGLAVYLVWQGRNGKNAKEALRAVVAGIESAVPSVGQTVKAEVAKHADATDKATIATIKLSDNL